MSYNYSLVIPTNNRPEFVKRFLEYYRCAAIKGEIIIVDGSTDENIALNLGHIDAYNKKGMSIRHTVSRDPVPDVRDEYKWAAGFGGRLSKGLELVRTPCVQMMCDDDFATVEYMNTAADFLVANQDYTMVMGRVVSMSLEDGNKAYGPVSSIQCTRPIPPRDEEKGVMRLTRAERMPYPFPIVYPQTLLAMTRADQWRAAAEAYGGACNALTPPEDTMEVGVEETKITLYYVIDIAHAYACLAAGKTHCVDQVMSVRHFHEHNEGGGGYSAWGISGSQAYLLEAVLSEQWVRVVNAVLEPPAAVLAENDSISIDDARAVLKTCFSRNVMPMLEHVIGNRMQFMSAEPAPKTSWTGRFWKIYLALTSKANPRHGLDNQHLKTEEMRRLISVIEGTGQNSRADTE